MDPATFVSWMPTPHDVGPCELIKVAYVICHGALLGFQPRETQKYMATKKVFNTVERLPTKPPVDLMNSRAPNRGS